MSDLIKHVVNSTNLFHYVGSPLRTAAVLLLDESHYTNVGLAGDRLPVDLGCCKTSVFVGHFMVVVEDDHELRLLKGTLKTDGLRVFVINIQPPLDDLLLRSIADCCASKLRFVRIDYMTGVGLAID